VIVRRLAELIDEEGGLLAEALIAEPAGTTPHGDLVGRGPRAAGHPADLPLVIEAVREGYLLHYGRPRILRDDDPDLALLAGDRLYALGLARLAEAGDLDSVAALADLISLAAQAQAQADDELAELVWRAGAVELGWGPTAALQAAKEAARAGEKDAGERLRAACDQLLDGGAPVA